MQVWERLPAQASAPTILNIQSVGGEEEDFADRAPEERADFQCTLN